MASALAKDDPKMLAAIEVLEKEADRMEAELDASSSDSSGSEDEKD